MNNPQRKITCLTVLLAVALIMGGCSTRYMLGEPVNDPIMVLDDQQDDDLVKCEDGRVGGTAGECPT